MITEKNIKNNNLSKEIEKYNKELFILNKKSYSKSFLKKKSNKKNNIKIIIKIINI